MKGRKLKKCLKNLSMNIQAIVLAEDNLDQKWSMVSSMASTNSINSVNLQGDRIAIKLELLLISFIVYISS
jgi:hypothetical protein